MNWGCKCKSAERSRYQLQIHSPLSLPPTKPNPSSDPYVSANSSPRTQLFPHAPPFPLLSPPNTCLLPICHPLTLKTNPLFSLSLSLHPSPPLPLPLPPPPQNYPPHKRAMYHSVDVAKTHEIMAKFRPIAPKPALLPSADGGNKPPATTAAHCLRARPCRARKRGRAGLVPIPNKRQKAAFLPLLRTNSQVEQFCLPSAQGFTRGLLPSLASSLSSRVREVGSPPVEQDLLKKLQEPRVIVPQPVRPVGSSISVGCITESSSFSATKTLKNPEEVEEEVESEALPAVISDSKNRVRMANSAYKEMVGQPECPWLDSMVSTSGGLGLKTTRAGASSRRINGEVMLELSESSEIPVAVDGFSCRVKIEWACNGKKSFVDAPCDVVRLYCDSKDYLYTWRIHTAGAFETNCKA